MRFISLLTIYWGMQMKREVFDALKIGTKISEPRGREALPVNGTLADKVGETALMRTGYTPGGKPILRWVHYAKLKKEI